MGDTIRKAIAEARAGKGLTQQQLADAAGVHFQHISKIERGEAGDPRISTVERLLGALGLQLVIKRSK